MKWFALCIAEVSELFGGIAPKQVYGERNSPLDFKVYRIQKTQTELEFKIVYSVHLYGEYNHTSNKATLKINTKLENKMKYKLQFYVHWTFVFLVIFIFTPFGVIYPSSLTSILRALSE